MDDIGDFFKGEPIFKMACDLFNTVIELIYSLLGVNPTAGSYEKVWDIVQNLATTISKNMIPIIKPTKSTWESAKDFDIAFESSENVLASVTPSSGFLVLVEAVVKILVIASGLKGAETVIKKATNL